MKKISIIVILLAVLTLGALIVWQINHLNESYKIKIDLDRADMQSALMESAVELRKLESQDKTLTPDTLRSRQFTDSILSQSFKNFEYDIIWGYYNGLKDPISNLNDYNDNEQLRESSLKVCMSCLLMIGIVKDVDPDTVTAKEIEESGYMLDHTPAQMRAVRGIDQKGLDYLHILPIYRQNVLQQYAIPIIFLVGLLSLFVWLIYLNSKQSKLIQQKNEFVNHLSHQFQTPLSSIKLSANIMANKQDSNNDELINIIQTESNRLENHIKTVLHWVKSDADRLQILKKEISVTDIIERSLRQMKPVFVSNKAKIKFVPSEEDYRFYADENHLQLMLFNIWENAIKHNETLIELKINYSVNDNYITISTEDNGRGLKKEQNPEKFKGLGLAYVRRIMSEHGGNMRLSSIEHSGLTVNLNFPL